jgi:hypothetical protein
MEICLVCAREEWNDQLRTCPDCGGRLWHPVDVGAIPGNEDSRLAAVLIRHGLKPWQPIDAPILPGLSVAACQTRFRRPA